MAFKFKGSLSAVDASLKGGVIFDNEKLSDSKIMPKGKFTINEIDESTTDLASNTLVTNFGKQDNIAGMFSFNTGDWKDTDSAPVKLMMRVVNDVNDSDWVTIFDSSKTTVTWSSIAFAGQTQFTVPNLDFKKAIIYVNGVLQYPGLSYQTFGGTVTFNSKLSTGDTIYVVVGEDTTNTDNEEFTATATEDQTVIVLPFTKKTNFVFINGILQYPDSYTVSGSTITLGDKLYLNDDILVLGNETDLVSFTALASQDQTDFTLPGEFDDGLVYINGVLQYDNAYSVSGTTLSFISSLDENDNVFVTLNDPKFIDSVNASYTSTITDESNNKLNIPYFNFSELQVFINGVLQNPDSGAYILNGTEVTLSSPLQLGDDIHVIVYNSPVQNSNLVTKADLTSYATEEELQELKNSLKNEGINLKWQPHLPSIEVAFGLPRRSLKIWTVGSTSTVNQYWLYPVDGTVWTGTGTLGTVPSVPFYKLDSNKDVITWTYTATSDNVTRIFVPYNFGSINIFINGVLQSINLNHYTLDGQYITLNGAMQTGDNLIAILGKLIFNTNPYITSESLNKYALKTDYISISQLESPSGFKFVGKCNSVHELRTIEPTHDEQTIILYRYDNNCPIVNFILYYDKNDTTSLDNGYSIFVTNNGARWKYNTHGGIDIRMAGIMNDGSNLGTIINKIVNNELSIIIDNNNILYGNTQIYIPSKLSINHNSQYKLDTPVIIPSFFSVISDNFIRINVSFNDHDAWTITNNIPKVTPEITDYINMQGSSCFDSVSGKIEFVGPGNDGIQTLKSGLVFGNISGGSTVLDVRDTKIKNLRVRGFYNGIMFHGYDTYINTFEFCDFVGNYNNISAENDRANGGETIIFYKCVVANSLNNNINWNMPLFDVTFNGCNIDYSKNNSFYFGELGRGNIIKIIGGTFIEGFGGYLVENSPTTLIPSVSRNMFECVDSKIIGTGKSQSSWSPKRQIIKDIIGNSVYKLTNTPVIFPNLSEPHVAAMGYIDNTSKFSTGMYYNPVSVYQECLMKYQDTINNGLFNFVGTPGSIITSSSSDAGTGYKFSKNNNDISIVYGDVDEDGYQSVNITCNNTSDFIEIFNPNLFVSVPRNARMYSAISVNVENLISGDVLLNTRIQSYNSDKITGYATISGSQTGIIGQWSVKNTPLTATSFLGIETFCQNSYGSASKNVYSCICRPSLGITGFTGTIKIKLPAFWVQSGFGLGNPI